MATTSTETKIATTKAVLTTAASVAGTFMLARSLAQDFLPDEFRGHIFFNIRKLFRRFSSQLTMVIDEFEGLVNNQIYVAAESYLGTKISPSTQRLKVSKPEKEHSFVVKMERNEEIVDVFQGVKFNWVFVCRDVETKSFYNPRDRNSTLRSEVRSFEVSFPKKHKDMALESYLPYIVREAESVAQEKKTLKIFTVDHENMYGNLADIWVPVNLDHPSTFDSMAMDKEVKDRLLKDLERFVKRKDYYRKVGKAWKRGYLLYGPPGTGKSSLIAAMANYLNFDIYDLELTQLNRNSDLRKLLVATANRSILVVEDIDCTIEFQDRLAQHRNARSSIDSPQNQVTLSGLLNFIDGLWSSCGDERIVIFTTNHKEKLDPALLRPGRMDVHIHLSYCTPSEFKVLAANYLGITDHLLFDEIEELIGTTEVTPAEVAEQLMRSDELETVLNELIGFLQEKKKENEAAKSKLRQEESAVDKVEQSTDKDKDVDNEEEALNKQLL